MAKVEDSLDEYSETQKQTIKIDLTQRNNLIKSLQKPLDYNDIDWGEEDE